MESRGSSPVFRDGLAAITSFLVWLREGTAVFVFGEDRSNEEFPRSKQINWKIFVSDLILVSIER